MPNTVVSPNMTITVPVVLTDPGPDWATRIYNALFTTIDQHDHSAGKGVQITPAGMNITADLAFGSFNATALRSTRFTNQGAPLALGPDVGCVYEANGELYFNDSSARQVRITNTGIVNGTSFARVVNAAYTVDSTAGAPPDAQLYCNTTGAAFNLTLPTPTLGRALVVIDQAGQFNTHNLTLVRHAAEKINGGAASKVLTVNFGVYLVYSNGVDWFVSLGTVV
jgi:hypothetical protein